MNTNSPSSVRYGVDVLIRQPSRWAHWQRVGLVTNDAARCASNPTRRSRVAMLEAGVPLYRLFGPEHGLGAVAEDGAAVPDGKDVLTGLPVVSLYGEQLRPSRAQMADLDVVLFDIPDVGARFYTYAWTLFHLLHACAEYGVPLVVLDRPNPLGGVLEAAEGPLLEEACRSFVGNDTIPVRHALTLGELARLWQAERVPSVQLDVIACEGWMATRAWPATGCAWVPTSPAMPHFDCAVWYPGTCLFEATNVSVARGTDAPFACIGAPWLDVSALVARVAVPGVVLTPCRFTPGSGPNAGERCEGVRLSLAAHLDHDQFVANDLRPVALGLTLLAAVMSLHPDQFSWAHYPTAANPEGRDHFARLIGRRDLSTALAIAASTPGELTAHMARWTDATGWADRVRPVLLYPR
jgi:uncharacterized protein YbbC (DUF1343 family)